MIPPVNLSGDSKQNLINWKNTFNMRQINLPIKSINGTKRGHHHQQNATKSLDLLRKNLQNAINKDIANVIGKYIDKFFQPALQNIKVNLGHESVNADSLHNVCRAILDDAKLLYTTTSKKEEENSMDEDIDFDLNIIKQQRLHQNLNGKPSKLAMVDGMGCKFSLKRDGPKWNPARIKRNTLFIMGSRANKVLGYGQTRGRLYVRHPNLLRYCGDQEDKEWLQTQNLLPANGGKIYIMLLEDIRELTESDEYRGNSAQLQLHELRGFEAPEFMNTKIKNFLEYIRNEKKLMAVLDNDGITTSDSMNDTSSMTPQSTIWRTSQLRQQIDYPNMSSSDMSHVMSSSVISSILAGTYQK